VPAGESLTAATKQKKLTLREVVAFNTRRTGYGFGAGKKSVTERQNQKTRSCGTGSSQSTIKGEEITGDSKMDKRPKKGKMKRGAVKGQVERAEERRVNGKREVAPRGKKKEETKR